MLHREIGLLAQTLNIPKRTRKAPFNQWAWGSNPHGRTKTATFFGVSQFFCIYVKKRARVGIRKARPAARPAGKKCRSTAFFSARERAPTGAPKPRCSKEHRAFCCLCVKSRPQVRIRTSRPAVYPFLMGCLMTVFRFSGATFLASDR